MKNYGLFKSSKDIFEIIPFEDNKLIDITIIGWEDGDHFIQLCIEDGGIDTRSESFFQKLPMIRKMNKNQFNDIVSFLDSHPYLHSNNNNVKFHYDIHVWYNKHYFIFNFLKKEFFSKKLNIFENIFKPTITPKWKEFK